MAAAVFFKLHCVFSQQSFQPDTIVTYKKVDGVELKLHVFYPEKIEVGTKTPAIVSFFGGGWVGGNPRQFYQQSTYYTAKGMIAFSAEYRVKNKHGTTPFEAVKDAKSAIRWVRKNADKFGIDAEQIIASGGSAGGHVAACTGIIKGVEESGEDLSISSVPDAMVLFNPVTDTTEKGYGSEKMNGRTTVISPNHHIRSNIPPTIIFHGDEDKTVPIENAIRFDRLMKDTGNICRLIVIKGVGHGFFNGTFFRPKNSDEHLESTMKETEIFLKELGFLLVAP